MEMEFFGFSRGLQERARLTELMNKVRMRIQRTHKTGRCAKDEKHLCKVDVHNGLHFHR